MNTTAFVSMIASLLFAAAAFAADPTVQELLDTVGIKPADGHRGQMDTVGFVTTAEQMDSVVAQAQRLSAPRRAELRRTHRWTDDTAFAAAVCPHDDYYYASRLYSLLVPNIKAKTVIIFGVFHKARVFDARDRLVFDAFNTWRGPYGPVAVSPLRADLIARLPEADCVVSDDMQTVEHSVEAIVPWLQAGNRDVEIVSVLVPYMDWKTMDRLAAEFADALAAIMTERGWRLGQDVALISSADAVHYGDAGWGGSRYADFGTDVQGYRRAVQRDVSLATETLCGAIDAGALETFLYTCVDPADVTNYKLTWCGRFSVPFGLNVAARVNGALDGGSLRGTLLDYGTSVGEVSLDLETIPGLGATAPNNLHHWVGYAAIGYEPGADGQDERRR